MDADAGCKEIRRLLSKPYSYTYVGMGILGVKCVIMTCMDVYSSRAGSKLVDRRLHDCAAASAGAPNLNPFPPVLLPRSKIIQTSFGILKLFLVLLWQGGLTCQTSVFVCPTSIWMTFSYLRIIRVLQTWQVNVSLLHPLSIKLPLMCLGFVSS